MFLSTSNLVHYLLARGHLTSEAILDGDFVAQDIGRRNRNFLVRRRSDDGLFVKQARTFGAFDTATLEREAHCYRLARVDAGLAPLQRWMPRWVDYDEARHCLILGLLQGSTLSDFHRREGTIPTSLAQQLGQALGTLHSGSGQRLAQHLAGQLTGHLTGHSNGQLTGTGPGNPQLPPSQVPWILRLHRATETTPGVSGGIEQFIQTLRSRPELTQPLDQLASLWRYDSCMHGDMKWDNCIIVEEDGPDGTPHAPRLFFIDWELADIGDADWDVGSILQAWLSCWILSMTVAPGRDPQLDAASARSRLESMWPSIHAFWQAYCATRGWPHGEHLHHCRPRLLRALSYGAARLLQTGYEYLASMPQMTGHSTLLMQTSANILHRPDRAAAELLHL